MMVDCIVTSESASLTCSECSVVQPSVHRGGFRVPCLVVTCVLDLRDGSQDDPADPQIFFESIRMWSCAQDGTGILSSCCRVEMEGWIIS